MRKTCSLALGVVFLALVVLAVSCGGGGTPSPTVGTPSPTTGAPSPTTVVPPSPTGPTFGQLATAGQTVYTNRCSGCHGDKGQGMTGPALIGTSTNLGRYNTAQDLLNYIRTAMPLSAPGSLSPEQYQQVLCFLLVQNNRAPAGMAFNAGQLNSITLK